MRKVIQRFDPSCWHQWFAWYPVMLKRPRPAPECMTESLRIWLEYVERRRLVPGRQWEYRLYGEGIEERLAELRAPKGE